jgi:putative hemolysin
MKGWGLVTREEITAMLLMGEAEGATTNAERELIDNILNLGTMQAHDIMVPRTDVVGLSDELTVAEAFTEACRCRHSRLPVFHDDLDDSWGLFSIVELPHCTSTEILTTRLADLRTSITESTPGDRLPIYPAHLFPETARVEKLLNDMRARRASMVVLVDEYGGTAGILTLGDILAEIVGQISPAGKAAKAGVMFAEDHLLVEGRTHLRELGQLLEVDLAPNGADTIGGYVMELLGHLPRPGDTVEDEQFIYQIIKMAGRRVGTLRMQKRAPEDETEEAAS